MYWMITATAIPLTINGTSVLHSPFAVLYSPALCVHTLDQFRLRISHSFRCVCRCFDIIFFVLLLLKSELFKSIYEYCVLIWKKRKKRAMNLIIWLFFNTFGSFDLSDELMKQSSHCVITLLNVEILDIKWAYIAYTAIYLDPSRIFMAPKSSFNSITCHKWLLRKAHLIRIRNSSNSIWTCRRLTNPLNFSCSTLHFYSLSFLS